MKLLIALCAADELKAKRKLWLHDLSLSNIRLAAYAALVETVYLTKQPLGNEAQAAQDKYGIMTLRVKHIAIADHGIDMQFKGVSGKQTSIAIPAATHTKLVAVYQMLMKDKVAESELFTVGGKPIPLVLVNRYLYGLGIDTALQHFGK